MLFFGTFVALCLDLALNEVPGVLQINPYLSIMPAQQTNKRKGSMS
jgi:hypothetical protein